MNFGLRSAGNGRLARHARPEQGSTYLRTAIIRYTLRAVGLKPPAIQGEARLRGLYRIIYSKTISPSWAHGSPCGAGVSVTLPYAEGSPGWSSPQGLPDLRQRLWRL